MRMRLTAFPAVLVLFAAGCAPVVPYHPPPHTGHPPTTDRGDGHGSTMPTAGLTRAGGMYPGAAADGAREHQQHGLDPAAGSLYGGAGYGTGAYGPIR